MWFFFANFFSKKSGWKNFWGKCSISKQNLKDIGNLNRLICREDIEKLDNKVLPFSNFTPKDFHQKILQNFPGGLVVKNPPANAEDTGSIPGLGRFHMPRGTQAHAPQLLRRCPRAWELQLLKPTQLEPVLRSKKQLESRSHSPQLEKAGTQQQNPSAAKNREMFFKKERKPYKTFKSR